MVQSKKPTKQKENPIDMRYLKKWERPLPGGKGTQGKEARLSYAHPCFTSVDILSLILLEEDELKGVTRTEEVLRRKGLPSQANETHTQREAHTINC